MALRDLNVKIGANTTGFNKGLKDVKSGISGLKTGISGMKGSTSDATSSMSNGIGSFIGKLGLAAIAFKAVTAAIREAGRAFMSFLAYEGNVKRVSSIFGEASKYVTYFAQNTAKSLGMSESAAYQFAATYGNLFRNVTKDSIENSKVSISMLKASAVIASKTGRTIEDVMERIRSGLLGNTESIEDIGIFVNIAMLEMTDAFKKIANGRSWEQLTFYEQQQIRVLGILEQAHTNYGDAVQKGSAFTLGTLKGAFSDMTAYAGQFINAGLQPIIKGLTQLVYWAVAGMKALAGLFGLKIETDTGVGNTIAATGAQDDLTEAIDKTAKAKQKLAGFDQINTLPSASGGANGGTGSGTNTGASVFDGIAMPEYVPPDTSALNDQLDRLREKFDFSNLTEALQRLKDAFEPLKEPFFAGLKWAWDNILVPMGKFQMEDVLPKTINTIADALGGLNYWLELIKPIFKWFEENVIKKVQSFFKTPLGGMIQDALGKVWSILQIIGGGGVFGLIILKFAAFKNVIDFASGALALIPEIAKGVWQSIKNGLDTISEKFKYVFSIMPGIARGVWQSVKDAFASVGSFFSGIWEKIKTTFTSIGSTVGSAMGNAFKHVINSIVGFAQNTINGFIRAINGAIGLINKIPGVNIRTLTEMTIPKMERGGIVSSPTMALIGENGKEAVMPLENNTGWIDKLAAKINSSGGGGDIYLTMPVYLDDGTLIDTIEKKISRNARLQNKALLGA